MSEINDVLSQFQQRMRAFVMQRVKQPEDAEDILQDVFVRISRNLGDVRRHQALSGWLFQITRNAIVDYYRKAGRAPEFTSSDALDHLASEPDTADASRAMAACLLPLLEQVPEPYRSALKQADFEGRTQQSIALASGVSVSGIKSRVQRGRGKLKALLQSCCRLEFDRTGHLMDYEQLDLQACRACGLVD